MLVLSLGPTSRPCRPDPPLTTSSLCDTAPQGLGVKNQRIRTGRIKESSDPDQGRRGVGRFPAVCRSVLLNGCRSNNSGDWEDGTSETRERPKDRGGVPTRESSLGGRVRRGSGRRPRRRNYPCGWWGRGRSPSRVGRRPPTPAYLPCRTGSGRGRETISAPSPPVLCKGRTVRPEIFQSPWISSGVKILTEFVVVCRSFY